MKTAQILIIGDEILSGRTLDTNSAFLAKSLFARGIRVQSIEVISDNLSLISQWVKHKHAFTDVTFICGGIGGTPDDLTRLGVAQGMGVKLVRNQEAEAILKDYYKEKINAERMSMADLPEGCTLIKNSVTKAPGFKIKNTYVFAGIPEILKAMFEEIKSELEGSPLFETTINLHVGEGEIAKFMKVIKEEYPSLELGSYPTLKNKGYRTQLVFRATDKTIVEKSQEKFKKLCFENGIIV